MFASQRIVPFSISASEMPSSTIVWRSSWRQSSRLVGRMEVRLRDDLHQRRATRLKSTSERPAPTIRPPAPPTCTVFARPPRGARGRSRPRGRLLARHDKTAVDAQRLVVLRDLIALGQVEVEVVLPVKNRAQRDCATECQAELHRPVNRRAVRDRQRPGMREAYGTGLRVLGCTEAVLTAAEQLRPRLQLHVDLQPDHRFPVHRSRSGTGSKESACSRA